MSTQEKIALPVQNAVALFQVRVKKSPDRVAFKSKVAGTWRSGTWRDWDNASRRIAGGLADLGVEKGDRVVILGGTREEWGFADVGILMVGGITVPIYPSNLPEQCEYIINDSGAKVCIVDGPHQLEKLLDPEVRGALSKVKKVILMSDLAHLDRPDAKGRNQVTLGEVLPQGHKDSDWAMSLDSLKERGEEWLKKNELNAGDSLTLDDCATIVYTSGTTGPPKGVVLSHYNLVFESTRVREVLTVGEDDEQLLFLPLAHIFAKVLLWVSIAEGMSIAYAESVPKLIANMGEVKPTIMGAVPRVYEKAYAKVKAGFEEKRKSPVGKLLIDFALKQGRGRKHIAPGGAAESDGLFLRAVDKLVFSKVKATFGGRLRFFVSGGAPLAREIAEFFHQAGVLILEGYGLTETTAATHVNTPTNYRFGTVGPAVPGVEVKIAGDGEILMRGPNIMKEYFGKPDATREVLEPDGWFHSGDIGEIDPDGHLRITDRKKDIIVTAGGKNVAPQNIENTFKTMCPLASQMMVYGDKRKYLSALITLSEEALIPWAKSKGLSDGDYASLTQNAEVVEAVDGYVKQMNADLPRWETVKKFKILEQDFDQETGELTPTLKVKRKFCSEKYRDILESFYDGPESTL